MLPEPLPADDAAHPALRRLLLFTSALPPLAALAIGVLRLYSSWDDGAITAAFSRTYAVSGRIALTPVSPQVEGFSSLSWFYIFAHMVFRHDPHGASYLILMKLGSALCFLAALPVLYLLSLRFLRDRTLAAFTTWLMAFCITPFYEAFNGMEMNLALLLFAALVWVLTARLSGWKQFVSAWLLITLILATRFESPYLLAALLAACIANRLLRRHGPSWKMLSLLSAGAGASFAAMEWWRYRRFGVWMPNTVYAKLWYPYQPPHTLRGLLASRASATWEIAVVLAGPLLVAAFLYATRRTGKAGRGPNPVSPVVVCLAVAALLFGLIFGRNLGHRGRMTEALLPFALMALVAVTSSCCRTRRQSGLALAAIAFLHLGLWSALALRIARRGDGQPIREYVREGISADIIRQQLGRKTISALIPDVGGAALCCQDVRILDLALLTNPVLARQGYSHFADYFRQSDPDVVDAHEVWAEASHIYDGGLLDNYSLVEISGIRLFVRNDLYARLLALHVGAVSPVADNPICLGNSAQDQVFSLSKKTCLVMLRK